MTIYESIWAFLLCTVLVKANQTGYCPLITLPPNLITKTCCGAIRMFLTLLLFLQCSEVNNCSCKTLSLTWCDGTSVAWTIDDTCGTTYSRVDFLDVVEWNNMASKLFIRSHLKEVLGMHPSRDCCARRWGKLSKKGPFSLRQCLDEAWWCTNSTQVFLYPLYNSFVDMSGCLLVLLNVFLSVLSSAFWKSKSSVWETYLVQASILECFRSVKGSCSS